MRTRNAVIKQTHLGTKWTDHGVMSYGIAVEGDGWGVTFGMTAIDTPVKDESGKFIGRRGTAYGCETIRLICDLFGCNWEDLPGQHCRVRIEDERAVAIGHFTKDVWFQPDDAKLPED